MLQAPIDIYVDEPLGGSTAGVLLLQAFWAVALILTGRLVLAAGTRKLSGPGVAELARIYVRLVGGRARSQLEYRMSLALQIVATALLTLLDFVMILVLFENVPTLDGWTVQEVALLYGLAAISFALTDLVVGHLDLFPQMIRDGSFDQILVRPLPSLLQVVASDFSLRRIGKVAQGIGVLAVALVAVDVDWSVGGGDDPARDRQRHADLRGRLDRPRDDRVLDRRRDRIRERLHLRRQLPLRLPDHDLRPLAAEPRSLRDPDCGVCSSALAVLDRPDELGLPEGLRLPLAPLVAVVTADRREARLGERRAALPSAGWLSR